MALQGAFRQHIPDLALSIEKGTDNVPDDGKYYVLKDGEVRGAFRSSKQAQELFNRLLAESGYEPKAKTSQKKTSSEIATERYLETKDFYWADSYKYRGGGGRGGRGGV